MDFYNAISSLGLTDFLATPEYVQPVYFGWTKVHKFLSDIIFNRKKCFIYGDYDVDGLMCTLIMRNGLRSMGADNVSVYNYRERTHNLDPVAVQECIQNHSEYFIICDTGSSDMELINLAVRYGIKVIVLDHHKTKMSYDDLDDNIAMINTEIENKLYNKEKFHLSAAALCYTVITALASAEHLRYDESIVTFALASLYSDCISMRDDLNRAIYHRAKQIDRENLPHCFVDFMNKYVSFNARYIGFWFAPRINAMFRSEQFAILNGYFLSDNLTVVQRGNLVDIINKLYEINRSLVDKLADAIEVKELNNFVIADLHSVFMYRNDIQLDNLNLYNYTGLVANQLSDRFNKTAVVYCRYNTYYKGSVRDIYSRNYLNLFQTLCYAGGHGAAFGIKINLLDLDEFLYNLNVLDQLYSIQSVSNQPIVVDYKWSMPDTALINDIAKFNEFSGNDVPIVLLKKQIIGDIVERKNRFNYKYMWADTFLIQSDYELSFGSFVLLKPIYSGSLKLLAQ